MNKRILIADSHQAVRRGIKLRLSGAVAGVEFGEALTRAEIFAKLRQENWDMVIFDIDMPGENGLTILKEIKAGRTRVPILVFTFYREDQYAVAAYEAGASGYLNKFSPDALLVRAVNKILKKQNERSGDNSC